MFYIYKKVHNKTGLKYLGYTKNDPFVYKGSGVRWTRHLDKHGNDVTTEIICECHTKEEVMEMGRYYSKLWNIVDDKTWANMKVEEGNGGDMSSSETWINSRKSKKFREKQSNGAKGNTNVRNYKWWFNPITNTYTRSPGLEWELGFVSPNDEIKEKLRNALKGKPKSESHKQKLKESAKNRPSNAKGTIWVKNKDGKRKRVYPDNIPEGYERLK